jgi:hypothetical protein
VQTQHGHTSDGAEALCASFSVPSQLQRGNSWPRCGGPPLESQPLGRQMWEGCQCEASLGYVVSSRLAWDPQLDPVPKQKQKL